MPRLRRGMFLPEQITLGMLWSPHPIGQGDNRGMNSPDTTSYWQATFPTAPLGQSLPPEVDLAVVGGGVLGAATAYAAARGGARVALLEQKGVAWGASGRNGGFITEGAGSTSRFRP